MKARIYFGQGKWWCRRMGCVGCGNTPLEAWADMWELYGAAIRDGILRSEKALVRVRIG